MTKDSSGSHSQDASCPSEVPTKLFRVLAFPFLPKLFSKCLMATRKEHISLHNFSKLFSDCTNQFLTNSEKFLPQQHFLSYTIFFSHSFVRLIRYTAPGIGNTHIYKNIRSKYSVEIILLYLNNAKVFQTSLNRVTSTGMHIFCFFLNFFFKMLSGQQYLHASTQQNHSG